LRFGDLSELLESSIVERAPLGLRDGGSSRPVIAKNGRPQGSPGKKRLDPPDGGEERKRTGIAC